MKKLAICVSALLLGASLSFAQDTGGSSDTKIKPAGTGRKVIKTKTYSKKGNKTGLTPAPIGDAQVPSKTSNPDSKVALNPQPLPPGAHGAGPKTPSATVTLNPQPLPPRVIPTTDKTNHNTKIKAKSKKGSGNTNTGSTSPK